MKKLYKKKQKRTTGPLEELEQLIDEMKYTPSEDRKSTRAILNELDKLS